MPGTTNSGGSVGSRHLFLHFAREARHSQCAQHLADIFGPVFEVGLEVAHKLACVGAVDDAVIEA
jgi:hypothetical protein